MKTVIVFAGTDPRGHYRECSYIGDNMETCLDTLTRLVRSGWELQLIRLFEQEQTPIWLPVEAFDGQSFTKTLTELRKDWTTALEV